MKTMIALLAGAMALGVAAPAMAQPEGWYLSAGAGASWMTGKANFTGMADTSLSYHGAGRFSGAVGYDWQGWRAELEPNWVTNNAGLTGYRGGSTVAALMANAAYDYHLDRRWTVTVGAGLGPARVSHELVQTSTNALLLGGHGVNLAWQIIGGVDYALTHNINLGLEYRYMNTGDSSAVSQFAPVKFENGQNNIVMASVRWYPFAEEKAAPPPPPPAPPPPAPLPPPPPPPAPVRTYVIFFDFDKSDVSAEARQVVSQAVQTVKQNGFAHIIVTGHTDTTGTARYNEKLSQRRADAVKGVMVDMGVSADAIATVAKGFTDPMVATGPGVREPKNRRAVIDLD